MKQFRRFLLCVGCVLLVAIAWVAAATATTDAQRQEELIVQAKSYLEDEVYIRAISLLEKAADYEDQHTLEAEELLKITYQRMMGKSGYARKYTDLLTKQMGREGAEPAIFLEAAQYYLDTSEEACAFAILRDGIEKTNSEEIRNFYEENRYVYQVNRSTFQDVTAAYNGAIQVKLDGYWGLAAADGSLVIPCEYDAISTFDRGEAVARKGSTITAIDSDNNRLALLHLPAESFSNLGNGRIGFKTADGWILADGDFNTGGITLEEIGMFADGCAPAKAGGKWGLLTANGTDWLIPPQYDAVIQDELGRCYAQNAVFVKQGGEVRLIVGGEDTGYRCEDAKPFSDGWAAVKQGGKWGFIDTAGNIMIDCKFDDALSFGQHLAAVKTGDFWGYISLRGEIVIKPQFISAASFCNGSAPVKTADGWQFITLLEYRERADGLL